VREAGFSCARKRLSARAGAQTLSCRGETREIYKDKSDFPEACAVVFSGCLKPGCEASRDEDGVNGRVGGMGDREAVVEMEATARGEVCTRGRVVSVLTPGNTRPAPGA
jgi:hypothetical protein